MFRSIDYDVIIIGGGLSGTAAALTFLEKVPHLDILILEANNFVGGRTVSVPLLVRDGEEVGNFDLGGQWIQKEHTSILKLLDKLDLKTVTSERSGNTVVHYKSDYVVSEAENFYKFLCIDEKIELQKFVAKVHNYCCKITKNNVTGDFVDTSMDVFIRENVKSNAVKAILYHVIFTHFAVPPQNVSLFFYLFFCCNAVPIAKQLLNESRKLESYSVKGGAQTICEGIIGSIGRDYIEKDCRVLEIIQYGQQVKIITANKTFICSYAILAIPPNEILKINFKPPLSKTKKAVLQNMNFGAATKFVVTYPIQFWKQNSYSGDMYMFENEDKGLYPIDFCNDVTFEGKAALSGFIFGQEEDPLSNEDFYKEKVLNQLAKTFGDEIFNCTSYHEKTWNDCTGCFTYCWGIHNIDYLNEISKPHNRIYFSGAETSTKWYGSMNGAVESGMKMAKEILYLIRPNSLDVADIEQLLIFQDKLKIFDMKSFPEQNKIVYLLNWKIVVPLCLIAALILYKVKAAN